MLPTTAERAVTKMIDNSTLEKLREIKMNGFAAELENQIKAIETYSQLSFEERIGLLVDAEWNRRQNNKFNRLLHSARFSNMMPVLRESNILRTDIWRRRKFSDMQHANT